MGWAIGGYIGEEVALAVGTLSAVGGVRWCVGRWERAKRKWWESWERVDLGLERDLEVRFMFFSFFSSLFSGEPQWICPRYGLLNCDYFLLVCLVGSVRFCDEGCRSGQDGPGCRWVGGPGAETAGNTLRIVR